MPSSSEPRVAVVTGAARGLGRAEALRFAELGTAVAHPDHRDRLRAEARDAQLI